MGTKKCTCIHTFLAENSYLMNHQNTNEIQYFAEQFKDIHKNTLKIFKGTFNVLST